MHLRNYFLLGTVFFGSATTAVSDEATWRAIPLAKDGKIADGWSFTGFGKFEVVDGMLKTHPDPRGLGLLFYEKEKFGDCEIKVVFRRENEQANSGVYVRIDDGILNVKDSPSVERQADGSLSAEASQKMEQASNDELGPWYAVHHGFEVQIARSVDPWHGTGSIYSLAKSTGASEADEGVWRTMIITLDGEVIRVSLDGKPVSQFNGDFAASPVRRYWHEPKRDAERPKAGYIGLQTHDPGDFVTFREIGVRPLK